MCLSRLCVEEKKEQITLSSEDFTIITTAKHQARKKVSYKDGTQYKSSESLPMKKKNETIPFDIASSCTLIFDRSMEVSTPHTVSVSCPESLPVRLNRSFFHFHFSLRLCKYVLLPS